MPSIVFETQEAQGLGAGGSSTLHSGTPRPWLACLHRARPPWGRGDLRPAATVTKAVINEPGIVCGPHTEETATEVDD